MINKRLMSLLPDTLGRSIKTALAEWLALLCSILATLAICRFFTALPEGVGAKDYVLLLCAVVFGAGMKCVFTRIYNNLAAKTARDIKRTLRGRVFDRLSEIGVSYKNTVSTAEAVQVGVEGVEQLETYFSQYLPQLFYSLFAAVTVFTVLLGLAPRAAVILIVCVPIIPLSIVGVQKIAKKLLSKYWDSYTELGDGFLENIQGLTTLKIYRSDELKHRQMNENAEKFRKATMRVLVMQLNSISVMDIVAYGGAAVATAAAISELVGGNIGFFAAMATVLLSAEFFLPLRRLGSFFHVAMNGAAASDKIFRILDAKERAQGLTAASGHDIEIKDMSYSYDGEKSALSGISVSLPPKGLFAVVGKSGCGKSTLAAILTGRLSGYTGSIKLGGTELFEISERALLDTVTLVAHDSYIFKGSVRYNLKMGDGAADDNQMISSLKAVGLWDYFKSECGLDTEISEQGANLSGGQRQRLAIARALMHDTPVYIFDEAASNVDAQSEAAINAVIDRLSADKLVIVISHRLSSVVNAEKIFVLADGKLAESGSHDELMTTGGEYAEIFTAQRELENYTKGGRRK